MKLDEIFVEFKLLIQAIDRQTPMESKIDPKQLKLKSSP